MLVMVDSVCIAEIFLFIGLETRASSSSAFYSSFLSLFFSAPGMKQLWWITYVGIVTCLVGELLRKLAMLTAGTNFNHIIQNHREKGHVLVTHGVYALCRHPSYVGWFMWSIGTQVCLLSTFSLPSLRACCCKSHCPVSVT